MESIGDIFSETFKIALFVKEVGRYLCFRRGKLVGLVSNKQIYILHIYIHILRVKRISCDARTISNGKPDAYCFSANSIKSIWHF